MVANNGTKTHKKVKWKNNETNITKSRYNNKHSNLRLKKNQIIIFIANRFGCTKCRFVVNFN